MCIRSRLGLQLDVYCLGAVAVVKLLSFHISNNLFRCAIMTRRLRHFKLDHVRTRGVLYSRLDELVTIQNTRN